MGASDGVQQRPLIFPFLNFATDNVLRFVSSNLSKCKVELFLGMRGHINMDWIARQL